MRTSNVSDHDVVCACISAKKRGWTIKDGAASVNMEVPAFRSRVNGLKKLILKQVETMQNKDKIVGLSDNEKINLDKLRGVAESLTSCFKDGRGVSPKAKEKSIDTILSLFENLDEE